MRATIGVLMLETQFLRIPGEFGNASSFASPIVLRLVRRATGPRIATLALDRNLLQSFIDAAQDLERECVRAITTSCGFLVLLQNEIAERLRVRFFASSLLQYLSCFAW